MLRSGLRLSTRSIFPLPIYHSFATSAMSTFYTLKATKKNDEVFDFADLKGKTVLIVNTASAWYDLESSDLGFR